MQTKHNVVRYNSVLGKKTRKVTSRSENQHKVRIYELNSIEQKVAFMNLLKTTRDSRKLIAKEKREHREDIKKMTFSRHIASSY